MRFSRQHTIEAARSTVAFARYVTENLDGALPKFVEHGQVEQAVFGESEAARDVIGNTSVINFISQLVGPVAFADGLEVEGRVHGFRRIFLQAYDDGLAAIITIKIAHCVAQRIGVIQPTELTL